MTLVPAFDGDFDKGISREADAEWAVRSFRRARVPANRTT